MNNLTVKDIRIKNKINVLNTIIKHNGITRNQLSKITKVSLMTITNVVDQLLESKYIYETKTQSSIGRTPTKLYIDNNIGIFICIDITSTKKFSYKFCDIKNKNLMSSDFNVDDTTSMEENINKLFDIINNNSSNYSIIGIGIVVSGTYNESCDTIHSNTNPNLNKIKFKKLITSIFKCNNIVIGQDVKMCAKNQHQKYDDVSSLYLINIAEGVSGAMIYNGRLLEGKDSLAGDFGQLITQHNKSSISINNLTSVNAILNHLKQTYDDTLTFKEILKLYEEEDEKVTEYFNYILKKISYKIFNVCWLFNPEKIVICSSYNQYAQIIADFCKKNLVDLDNKVANQSEKHLTTTIECIDNLSESKLNGIYNETLQSFIKTRAKL